MPFPSLEKKHLAPAIFSILANLGIFGCQMNEATQIPTKTQGSEVAEADGKKLDKMKEGFSSCMPNQELTKETIQKHPIDRKAFFSALANFTETANVPKPEHTIEQSDWGEPGSLTRGEAMQAIIDYCGYDEEWMMQSENIREMVFKAVIVGKPYIATVWDSETEPVSAPLLHAVCQDMNIKKKIERANCTEETEDECQTQEEIFEMQVNGLFGSTADGKRFIIAKNLYSVGAHEVIHLLNRAKWDIPSSLQDINFPLEKIYYPWERIFFRDTCFPLDYDAMNEALADGHQMMESPHKEGVSELVVSAYQGETDYRIKTSLWAEASHVSISEPVHLARFTRNAFFYEKQYTEKEVQIMGAGQYALAYIGAKRIKALLEKGDYSTVLNTKVELTEVYFSELSTPESPPTPHNTPASSIASSQVSPHWHRESPRLAQSP